ncbi:MAG: beta-N-acetylhexosaminidase [Candidatus Dormibacteria bacterium]
MTAEPALLPEPQRLVRRLGNLSLRGARIEIEAGRPADAFAASLLRDELGSARKGAPEILIGDPTSFVAVKHALDAASLAPHDLATEGYLLHSSASQVVVAANTAEGVFHGVQTLIQLARGGGTGLTTPHLTIEDWPDFEMRMYFDDIARGQVSTLDDFKNIIRRLASLKINYYGIPVQDNFEFSANPAIGAGRGRLSKSDVADLVAFAGQHHVEIIPQVQSLGHMEGILSLPGYSHFREVADDPYLISPVVPGVYEFLEELIREVAEAFPCHYLVVGTDEALSLGKGASKARADELGVSALWISHVKRLREICQRLGKTAVVPFDMFDQDYYQRVWGIDAPFAPEDMRLLPRDVMAVVGDFEGNDDYPAVRRIIQAGFETALGGGIATWCRLFPRNQLARDNVASFARIGRTEGARMTFTASFGDQGADNLRELNWYGVAFFGNAAWKPDAANQDRFDHDFVTYFFGGGATDLVPVLDLLASMDDHFPMPPVEAPSVKRLHIHAWAWFYAPLYELPLVPEGEPSPGLAETEAALLDARLRLDRARSQVLRNEENLDCWDLAIDRSLHLVRRFRGIDHELVADLDRIRDRLCELWLRTNRPEGLETVRARFAAIREAYVKAIRPTGMVRHRTSRST